VTCALLLDRCSPLEALSLPRWTYFPGSDKMEAHRPVQLHVDATADEAVIRSLIDRGHDVVTKASVGRVNRLAKLRRGGRYGLDHGRPEGLTAGI
jgi:gamma-glutamyltranspeptidase/glutathione hydrolase